jgi:hypothetical protein
MNMEIRTEAAQFLFWEYINSNLFAVQPWPLSMIIYLPFIKQIARHIVNANLQASQRNALKIKKTTNVVVV